MSQSSTVEGRKKLSSLSSYFVKADDVEGCRDNQATASIVEDYEVVKRAKIAAAWSSSSSSGAGAVSVDDKENANSSAATPSEDTPLCSCANPAPSIVRTVMKDGPNRNRRFFVCASPRDQQCAFFEWADNNPPKHPTEATTITPLNGPIAPLNGPIATNRLCRCNDHAVLKTVQKEGANKGRTFYSCGKPRESACNFFEWSDSTVSQAAPVASIISSSGASSTGGRTESATCYKCGGQGHWAKTCSMVAKGSGGGGGGGGGGACYKCGKSGHFANNCIKSR